MEGRQLRAAAAEQHGGDAADGRRRALHDGRDRAATSWPSTAATGETLWMYRLDEGRARRRGAAQRQAAASSTWTDGTQVSASSSSPRAIHLVSLDAKTGIPDPAFGKNGVVDLYRGFRSADSRRTARSARRSPRGGREERDRHRRRAAGRHGAAIEGEHEGLHPRLRRAHGQAAVDVPHDSAARRVRQRHVAERFVVLHRQHGGLVAVLGRRRARLRVPAGRIATGDFYGGHRPGNNLFAGSLVCLDAKTGKRVWHQQLVHHDIWDYDLASPPTLINITVNGRPIRAVAQVTKWSYLFVFDRVTGKPVWPIEERPVPKRARCRASGIRRRSRIPTKPRAVRSPGRHGSRI